MKPFGVLIKLIATTLVVSSFPVISGAQSNIDSVGVNTYVESYRSAWNRHDPARLAEFFTEDADFIMGNMRAIQGREEILNWWQRYFEKQEQERQLSIQINSQRFLADSIVLLNIRTTTGGKNNQGDKLIERKFRGTWLMSRHHDSWLICAMLGLPMQEDSVALSASVQTQIELKPHIRAFVASYEDAFNSKNPSQVTALFRPDADIIIRNSPIINGSEAVRKFWQSYFSTPRPYKAVFIINEINMVTDNVAFVNITATGAIGKAQNQPNPVRKTRASWVLVLEDGEWLISALRVMPSEEDSLIRKIDN